MKTISITDDLCPSCGSRYVDTPSGFCSPCVVDRAAANYSAEDRARAASRSAGWAARAADAPVVALRQQRRRMIATIRPTVEATSHDPWEVASSALAIVRRLQLSTPAHRRILGEVAEALRRLAWGPDQEGAPWIHHKRPPRRQIPGQTTIFDVLEGKVAA